MTLDEILGLLGGVPQAGNMLATAGQGAPTPLAEINVPARAPVPLPPVRPQMAPQQQALMPVSMQREAPMPPPQQPNGAAVMAGFGGGQSAPTPSLGAGSAAPGAMAAPARSGGLFNLDPDMKDKLFDLFSGLASGKDFNSSVANAGLMMAEGRRDRRDRVNVNQTREAAIAAGLDPRVAAGLDGKSLASFVIQQQQMKLKGVEPTDDIREYTYAKQQGFEGSFSDWQTKKRGAGDNEYGVSPVYGTDAQGNPTILQLGKQGGAKQVELPAGVKLSTGVEKIDLGTQWALQDKKSGQIVGYMPKDVAGESSAKAAGTAQGEAKVALPAAENSAQIAMDTVDQLLADPNRESSTGGLDHFKSYVPGTAAYGYSKRVDQAKGQAFLAAMNTLRGTGAISEAEGSKATQALARLDTAQSDEDFRQALTEYKDIIARGLAVSRQKAGGGAPAAASAPSAQPRVRVWNPTTGRLE